MADAMPRPTEEESARRILSTFREIGAAVGQTIPTEQLRLGFLGAGKFQANDFEEGAKSALQQGWIGFVGGTGVKLLMPGENEIGSGNET